MFTIWSEQVAVVDCNAEHVFLQVSDSKLHRCIPLGIQSVLNDLRLVFLGAHTDLTIGVTFTCRHRQHNLHIQSHSIVYNNNKLLNVNM